MYFKYLLLCASLTLSCQSKKGKIFKAEKNEVNNLVRIEIFKDFQYNLSIGDSLLEEGQAQIKGRKLTLIPTHDNPLNTLVHNKEFKIIDNRLCRIKYVQVNKDTLRSELVAPVEVIDKLDCFEIKKFFK